MAAGGVMVLDATWVKEKNTIPSINICFNANYSFRFKFKNRRIPSPTMTIFKFYHHIV
jgi:hypothetical protein